MVAEWSIENTRIITELFVKQMRAGNRPNTHLTSNAYDEVGRQFKIRTGLEYNHDQLKNKWDKLRGEYSVPPNTPEEKFNRLHSSKRNCIERAFGVWKMKWQILLKMPSYSIETQKMIVATTMALHNYVRFHDKSDLHFVRCDRDPDYVPTIPEQYKKFVVPTKASDTSTSEENGVDMDLIRTNLLLTLL